MDKRKNIKEFLLIVFILVAWVVIIVALPIEWLDLIDPSGTLDDLIRDIIG